VRCPFGGLLGGDAEGEMTVYGDLSAPSLIEEREVGFPGDVLVDLDEIGAIRGELFHYGPSLRRGAHDDLPAESQGRIAIDRRTGAEESGWAETTSLRQLALDRLGQPERHVAGAVVHIANTGDAVSEKQGKVPVLGRD
jgi:hypothetical protein